MNIKLLFTDNFGSVYLSTHWFKLIYHVSIADITRVLLFLSDNNGVWTEDETKADLIS